MTNNRIDNRVSLNNVYKILCFPQSSNLYCLLLWFVQSQLVVLIVHMTCSLDIEALLLKVLALP